MYLMYVYIVNFKIVFAFIDSVFFFLLLDHLLHTSWKIKKSVGSKWRVTWFLVSCHVPGHGGRVLNEYYRAEREKSTNK